VKNIFVIKGEFFEIIMFYGCPEKTDICSGYYTSEDGETIVTSEHKLAI